MSIFLLIHGAWDDGGSWRKVVPLLEAKGHTVLAPDLPSHGGDKTPPASVTLQTYADRICEIAAAQSEPVILVGHSMGGVAITQGAEDCPARFRALVYLCAFLPRNGDSLITWASQDTESLVNPNIIPMGDGVVGLNPEPFRSTSYVQSLHNDAKRVDPPLVPQASAPFAVPVKTTPERWGSIPRYYIECLRDRALTLRTQREMQKHSPCARTFSIDTDHSPFLSRPERLAEILCEISG